MFSIGAFAVILDQQRRVLLCHRRDLDIWNLPGGGVASGELPTEAAVREVKEETGLDVAIDRLVGVYGKTDKDELVFAFACRIVGGEIAATAEADKCEYFEMERIPSNTAPKHVGRIRDALGSAVQPVIRRQTEQSTREMLQLQRQAPTLRGENGG